MTVWGTEPVAQVPLREPVLTGHCESKTPGHVKKPHYTKVTSTKAFVILVLNPSMHQNHHSQTGV